MRGFPYSSPNRKRLFLILWSRGGKHVHFHAYTQWHSNEEEKKGSLKLEAACSHNTAWEVKSEVNSTRPQLYLSSQSEILKTDMSSHCCICSSLVVVSSLQYLCIYLSVFFFGRWGDIFASWFVFPIYGLYVLCRLCSAVVPIMIMMVVMIVVVVVI